MEINCNIRDNDPLRGSFNSLTREVFGSDFEYTHRLAALFGAKRAEYRYTPADIDGLTCPEHKEDDTTLFIMGDDLSRIERGRLMFPEISHA